MLALGLTSVLASSVELTAPPTVEQQFYASVKFIKYQDGAILTKDGADMYYDPPNQRWRQSFANKTMVADYGKNIGFIISPDGSCQQHVLPPPISQFTIPPAARDVGPATVSGGQPAEGWETIETDAENVTHTLDYAVQTQPATGRSPVLLLSNDTYKGTAPFGCLCTPVPCRPPPVCIRSTVSDFSNGLVVGPMADSLFAMPTGCAPGKEPLAFGF